jgi:hypothetical protein
MSNMSIFAKLVLPLVFLTVASGLKIHPDHFSSIPIEQTLLHLQHDLQYRVSHDPTHDGHDAYIPTNVFSELRDYVANDPIIINRIHSDKQLSKISAEKVKSFFLDSDEFKEFTVKNLVASAKDPDCLEGIDDHSKDLLFRIILDQLDFSTIFLTDKPE